MIELIIGIGPFIGFIAAYLYYGNWLTNAIKPRQFETRLTPDVLRDLFSQKVAGMGWKIVDDGNPMVAQSPLATGIRQQISLRLEKDGDVLSVSVGPERWVTKFGTPKKGHTIRMRLNGFVNAVAAQDPTVQPRMAELRGR